MAKEKTDRPKMGDLIKSLPATSTPVQEVRPVATPKAEEELVKLSGVWVPKSLERKLKFHAVDSGKSLKEITIEAYEVYFAQLNK